MAEEPVSVDLAKLLTELYKECMRTGTKTNRTTIPSRGGFKPNTVFEHSSNFK